MKARIRECSSGMARNVDCITVAASGLLIPHMLETPGNPVNGATLELDQGMTSFKGLR